MSNTKRGHNLTYIASSASSIAGGAFDVDPVAGDCVLVAVRGFENYSVSSVTDNAGGNTYALVAGTRQYGSGTWVEIWQCQNVNTTSGFAVTANFAGACTARGICGVAIAGAATASAIDLAGGATPTGNQSGTDVLTTGSLGTPSTDGQFVFAVGAGSSTPDNFNPGTGFTGLGSYTYNEVWRVEYLIQSTAAAVAGTFTEDNTYAGAFWAVAACTVKAAPSGTTLYFLDSAASNSNFSQLQVGGSAPSTATTATGWTVDTVASGNYALMAYASERASSVFSGTAQPAGNPDNSLGDCFRSTSTMSGDFATGVWTIAVPVIAVSAAAGQDGRVRVRLWKSANATGTSPTEITSGAVAGTTVTNLTTGAEQVSTVTTGSITGFSMTNEYLFVQIAWEITGAAT